MMTFHWTPVSSETTCEMDDRDRKGSPPQHSPRISTFDRCRAIAPRCHSITEQRPSSGMLGPHEISFLFSEPVIIDHGDIITRLLRSSSGPAAT